MSWESTVNKSKEEVLESEQTQREEVILNHHNTLNLLDSKITVAKETLAGLLKDIDQVHANRLAEYKKFDDEMIGKQAMLNQLISKEGTINDELDRKRESLNRAIDEETARFTKHNTALLAQRDQLNALASELEAQKQLQESTANSHVQEASRLTQWNNELKQMQIDQEKVSQDVIDRHHVLKQTQEDHAVVIAIHEEAKKSLLADQEKNAAFYNALVEREVALDPLKQKYEEGILANEKEANRLKDMHIESFSKLNDAEKRLNVAIEAEMRAKTEAEKLEKLKNDIHSKITPIKES